MTVTEGEHATDDAWREQVRRGDRSERRLAAIASRKYGLFWRPILVTKAQLDQLEVRGYLDPDLRGNAVDEADAVEVFLTDTLSKSK